MYGDKVNYLCVLWLDKWVQDRSVLFTPPIFFSPQCKAGGPSGISYFRGTCPWAALPWLLWYRWHEYGVYSAVRSALSNKRLCFDTRSLHVRSVVDKVAQGRVLLRVLRFYPVISLHQSSILHLYAALNRRTKWRSLETIQKAMLFRILWSCGQKNPVTWSLKGQFDLQISNTHSLTYSNTSYGQKQTCFCTLGNEPVAHEVLF